jgi:hypothetical protein
MAEVVLILLNTDRLQQVEYYGRGCSTSTKYWLPSTSWILWQRLFYFYHILTAFNKLKIMSEVVLLLLNTDRLQQVEYYGRGCSTSTKYLTPFNKLNIMSKVAHDNWWRSKTIYRFHKSAFDRGDCSLECFDQITNMLGLVYGV